MFAVFVESKQCPTLFSCAGHTLLGPTAGWSNLLLFPHPARPTAGGQGDGGRVARQYIEDEVTGFFFKLQSKRRKLFGLLRRKPAVVVRAFRCQENGGGLVCVCVLPCKCSPVRPCGAHHLCAKASPGSLCHRPLQLAGHARAVGGSL
jgi:hypothetical protein